MPRFEIVLIMKTGRFLNEQTYKKFFSCKIFKGEGVHLGKNNFIKFRDDF